MLHHLCRFGAHEDDLRREWREQLLQQRALGVIADADDETVGLGEDFDGFTESQILWRAGEVELRELDFEFRAGADRELGKGEIAGGAGCALKCSTCLSIRQLQGSGRYHGPSRVGDRARDGASSRLSERCYRSQ